MVNALGYRLRGISTFGKDRQRWERRAEGRLFNAGSNPASATKNEDMKLLRYGFGYYLLGGGFCLRFFQN